MNIALVIIGDNNVIENNYCGVVIKSFLYNNSWFNGDIIFFEDNSFNKISEDNKNKLRNLYHKIIFKYIDFSKYENALNLTLEYRSINRLKNSKFLHAYPKFEIFNLIEYDKILCIDSDIVINDNIKELFEKNISLGVTSSLRYFYEDLPFNCKLSYKHFKQNTNKGNTDFEWDGGGFNSGVMYLGNKKFINEQIYNDIYTYFINYINCKKTMNWFDQNILNAYFYNKYMNDVTWISPIYNMCIFDFEIKNIFGKFISFKDINYRKNIEALNKAKIIHYIWKYKDIPNDTKMKLLFEKYLNMLLSN